LVTVDYTGRTGNHLFQYTMARLIAERNDLAMMSPMPGTDFLQPVDHEVKGSSYAAARAELIGDRHPGLPNVNVKYRAHLHGFFQKSWYYNPHRQQIKTFFRLNPIEKVNTQDIVLHLRLTDYFHPNFKCVISPLWYFDILSREKYDKVYIVVENHPTNEKYLGYFRPYKPIIVSGTTAMQDFDFIRSFNKIVCSNSTFCWWASFLSEAETIYTMKEWMGIHIESGPDLAEIDRATALSGTFYRDRQLELYDWKDYWKK